MFLINFICESKKRISLDRLNENKYLFNKKIRSNILFFGFKDPELEKVNQFSFTCKYRTCCNSNHCRDTY